MNPNFISFPFTLTLFAAALSPWAVQLTAAEIASPFEAAAVATGKSPHVDSKHQFVLLDTLIDRKSVV